MKWKDFTVFEYFMVIASLILIWGIFKLSEDFYTGLRLILFGIIGISGSAWFKKERPYDDFLKIRKRKKISR